MFSLYSHDILNNVTFLLRLFMVLIITPQQ